MKIEDYEPLIHISRHELDQMCHRIISYYNWDATYCYALNKSMANYGCFDSSGRYFGNLGLEIVPIRDRFSERIARAGDHAHFNFRGVNPAHFGIDRYFAPKEFAPFMKHHPPMYRRINMIKHLCNFENIHIHEDINVRWGAL